MIFKSFIIEKNIKLLDTNSANIFYGENIGLKDDLKIQIKNLYEDYEILTLMQDEILKNHDFHDFRSKFHDFSSFSCFFHARLPVLEPIR